jgi:hypothetical protein
MNLDCLLFVSENCRLSTARSVLASSPRSVGTDKRMRILSTSGVYNNWRPVYHPRMGGHGVRYSSTTVGALGMRLLECVGPPHPRMLEFCHMSSSRSSRMRPRLAILRPDTCVCAMKCLLQGACHERQPSRFPVQIRRLENLHMESKCR